MKEKEKTNIELILERIAKALENIEIKLDAILREKRIDRASNDTRKNY